MTEVTVRSSLGLGQEISTRAHALRADEPIPSGGSDSGPTPYELLLAALGACTAITLRLYADRKGWPLHGVEIVLNHERIHAQDCADCETQEGYLDRIEKRLTLLGPLDEEQRARLADIASRCPVNLTLQREIKIEQSLAPAA